MAKYTVSHTSYASSTTPTHEPSPDSDITQSFIDQQCNGAQRQLLGQKYTNNVGEWS